MNHSVEFLINRIQDGTIKSEIGIPNWEKCKIYTFPEMLESCIDRFINLDRNGNEFTFQGRKAYVDYDPNADFDYVAIRGSNSDSTLCFLSDDVLNCVSSILGCATWPKDKCNARPKACKYIVGDVLIAESIGNSGPSSHSFIHRVAIPVKFELIQR